MLGLGCHPEGFLLAAAAHLPKEERGPAPLKLGKERDKQETGRNGCRRGGRGLGSRDRERERD
jgi:hypothetical protein